MTDPDVAKLIAGYATRTLTAEEEQRLLLAAAEDQSIFDAIADEEDLRTVLDDFPLRQRVLRTIAEKEPHASVLASFLRFRPMRYALAGAMAAAAVIGISLRYQKGEPVPSGSTYTVPMTAGFAPISMRDIETMRRAATDANADPLSALPPQIAIPVELGFSKEGAMPVFAPGESMRMGFESKAEANVVVIETRADGSTLQLFPNRYISSERVPANQQVLIPPAGQGDMQADGPAGVRRVRLIAAPVDIDLLTVDLAHTAELSGKVSVVDREYSVGAAK